MKLFTLGPVEMYPRTLEIAKKQIPYFRTPEFSQAVLECERLLKRFAGAGSDTRTVFLTASGTAAMEASVINCFDGGDRLLVIDGGSFGHRFTQICDIHGIPYDALKLNYPEALTRERLYEYDGGKYSALLVNLDETSTGQLYDINMLSEFCGKNQMLLVVDAISAFLADPVDMERDGVDVLIFSSQKSLALAPGLSIVLLSKKVYNSKIKDSKPKSMYFDFNSYIENGRRGQTPFTPAVRVIYELLDMLTFIEEQGGVQKKLERSAELAADFRKRAREIGLSIPDYPLSNAVTPLYFPQNNAKAVYEELKRGYEVFVTPNGGELADSVLRVGHLGNHTIEDNIELAELLKKIC